jgi:hypothetical protein
MHFNRQPSQRAGLTPVTRGLRPVYSNQKRFAATQAGNKGGTSRLYVSHHLSKTYSQSESIVPY